MKWNMTVAVTFMVMALQLEAAEPVDLGNIEKLSGSPFPLPIAVLGYSGEVDSTLKFDLEVLGFKIVPESQADFILTGSNSGTVQGTLKFRGTSIMSGSVGSGSPRAQAHTLADQVIKRLRKVPGIAHSKIVYKADAGQNRVIYYSDYDGANAQAITSNNALLASPSFSNGRVYYMTYEFGPTRIIAQNLSGERSVVVKQGGSNFSPAPSPDGTKLAFISSASGSPDLWVSDSNGGNPVRLTTTRETESSPCWSAKGDSIYFVSNMTGSDLLYKISASGGKPQKISVGQFNISEPDCSPDGKYVVFNVRRGGGSMFEIYVAPAEGGEATFLTQGEDPCFAANSRTVIFTKTSGGRTGLSLLDVPTKQVKDVPKLKGNCSQPSWAN